MPGKIISVKVKAGDAVAQNQIVAVLEAMKMENEIQSEVAGTVKSVSVKAGRDGRGRPGPPGHRVIRSPRPWRTPR